jgi:hypothetical protein
MSELTRRGFVRSSAGVGAGITAIGALGVGQGSADAKSAAIGSHPVVAYVRDPRSGEIALMSGGREVTVRDRKLAAQIARAAG